ncbi:hypothetical protein [Amorphus sp. 3PC139-8]|uniref:hypothetical protein n=1 Tax=Amorphus sp. 3PC139-8 TaxID=2735676 RepID=UPI00345CD9DC
MDKKALLVAAMVCGLAQPAMAATSGKWGALSNTATSITGDIDVSANAVTFANGKSLKIEAVGSKKGAWSGTGDPVEGEIFKLVPPSDPVLLNGNQFCGLPDHPATYIVLAPDTDDGMSMVVFTTDSAPTPESSPCAIYNYGK